MRKEAYSVESYVHVAKRGTRGLPIVRDESDRQHFLLMLAHFNDDFSSLNWRRDLYDANLHHSFKRPEHWPEQQRIVNIISFCLVENHFHLLLQEIIEGGIARFMQRLGIGMTKRFNERYEEKGSLFQGAYRAKTVQDDDYFRYVSVYVQVKNAFDVHPKGYHWARDHFNEAYDWAANYQHTSLGDYVGTLDRPILHKEFLSSLYTPNEYCEFARDIILGRNLPDEDFTSHSTGFFE